jgi:hypothetical protein
MVKEMLQRYQLLTPLLAIFIILFSIELALEFRHYRLGWDTPILGAKLAKKKTSESKKPKVKKYGPIKGYPFRSKILAEDKGSKLRLWIASASHAEHSRLPVKRIFPNLICQSVTQVRNGCETINGSKAGIGIDKNLAFLNEFADKIKPDYVLLYQSTQIISGQQKSIVDAKLGTASGGQNSLINFAKAKRFFQKMSAYQHLIDYIGGNIKLQSFMHNKLPPKMDVDYENQIMTFINSARSHHAQPILITFAAAYNSENIDSIPRTIASSFVRYSTYLSADGWAYSIERYNVALRRIAARENVLLIDLESELHGEFKYFVDYVHFNEKGHARVAEYIGREMNAILQKEDL